MGTKGTANAMERGYRLGVDTGGTFTDFCLMDDTSGHTVVAKVPSTPDHPADAVLSGIQALMDSVGFRPRQLRFLIHGTTVATNTLLERTGAPTALLTTEGFEDVLHIGRQDRPALYDFRARRPEPIVPRRHRFGLPERVLHNGEVFRPLDTQQTEHICQAIQALGIRSVAVCLIHAYANPVHEQAVRSILARTVPDACITLSSEVLPEFREYERTSTVCVNAYVMPRVRGYVADLETRLRSLGASSDLFIMQSNGGVITAQTACTASARTLLSGPAGGALMGVILSRTLETPDVITLDMGGTSTDICLIEASIPRVTAASEIGGCPIRLPMIDIHTIGAGGGSIARIDSGGALRVGPQSAGVTPGPACYGRGGTEPTVTDANVVLGRLSPASLLAGAMPIQPEAAKQVVYEKIARPLGMNLERAAEGILEVVNANMLRAIRRVSVERGYDPRRFSLVAFGGAGPLHGAALARSLDMREVIVPPCPGIASALGMLSANVRHDYVQTNITRAETADPDTVSSVFTGMEARAKEQLSREGFTVDGMEMIRSADMRYPRQAHELNVPLEGGVVSRWMLCRAASRFHDLHEAAYGYARRTAPAEIVNLRLAAVGELPALPRLPEARPDAAAPVPSPAGWRRVVFEGRRVHTPVYRRDALTAGHEIAGPALVEQLDATLWIPPRCRAHRDRHGNIRIRLSEPR